MVRFVRPEFTLLACRARAAGLSSLVTTGCSAIAPTGSFMAATVPCIPDSIKALGILTPFQHVGRLLTCKSGGKFDRTTRLTDTTSNDPRFIEGVRDNLRNSLRALLAGRIFAPTGPGPLGRLFALLPFGIRDHLPDLYLKALEP
jgi:hypothetical protein